MCAPFAVPTDFSAPKRKMRSKTHHARPSQVQEVAASGRLVSSACPSVSELDLTLQSMARANPNENQSARVGGAGVARAARGEAGYDAQPQLERPVGSGPIVEEEASASPMSLNQRVSERRG